ncbi:MAG TPA: hypothetical protein VJ871_01540, partial [Bacteroidales bacterium]|nr:hypothetical protein [Bacteroidales bacterium]
MDRGESFSPDEWDLLCGDTDRSTLVFDYPDTCGNGYLDSLRATYALDQLIVEDSNDLQRIASVLDWTSQQW